MDIVCNATLTSTLCILNTMPKWTLIFFLLNSYIVIITSKEIITNSIFGLPSAKNSQRKNWSPTCQLYYKF